MSDLWISMGFIRYPVGFSWLAVVLLSLYSMSRLFGWSARADLVTKAWIDAVFFWGAFGMMSGVLGTLLGVILAAQSIEMAGAVSTTLVWGGIKVAMLSSAAGTVLLCLAALSWFGLQFRWRMLQAGEVGDGNPVPQR
jgi:MotA/TolQ/ExbB proton channel family protein